MDDDFCRDYLVSTCFCSCGDIVHHSNEQVGYDLWTSSWYDFGSGMLVGTCCQTQRWCHKHHNLDRHLSYTFRKLCIVGMSSCHRVLTLVLSHYLYDDIVVYSTYCVQLGHPPKRCRTWR